ncbi:M90 family metallopeptidase [Ottowia sp.]|uniref:M90 family metallopeptidase n=1 Tax=Ottowia sp. TaxID=1898956 RepID=UPI002D023086|nr:M90 family metallopeptidase [Ottowia sp.]HRN75167.1 zinc-dependent peptidase [Ottowia sp.]HRQ03129.1 zinc-dependent peptidase [Ottowia sp.]
MLKTFRRWMHRATGGPTPIPDALWQATLAHYPFLARLGVDERQRLHRLATHFLDRKEFIGAHELEITDEMAVAVAAQACLPLLHLGPAETPEDALHWYDDFVGIVMHPDAALARRQVMDDAGVLHHYDEVLSGEAMQHGPVMLSWPAVQSAGAHADAGYSVVIHEFVHKMDMQDGGPDGAPPLPRGFMGATSAREAARHWAATWAPAYARFREQLIMAERFGAPAPWLDPYGATAPAEFFAVACEAHFVQPERFAQEFPELARTLRAFFRQG